MKLHMRAAGRWGTGSRRGAPEEIRPPAAGSGVSATVVASGTSEGPMRIRTPMGRTDVTFRMVTIEPGGSTGWHTHRGEVIAVVTAGTLTRVLADRSVQVTAAGTSFIEPAGSERRHIGRNLGTEPVVLWLTYLLPEGSELSDAAPAPADGAQGRSPHPESGAALGRAGDDGGVRLEAITWERLAGELARHADGLTAPDAGPWRTLGIDGAPAARTGELAERVAQELRLRGRAVLVVSTEGFLRPASLRFEYGKRDPDAYADSWFDTGALWREVFGPLEAGGSGRVLPDLWDPATDRATRTPYHPLPEGGVVVVHGPLLLGHWFPFALSVHLRLSPGALRRRTAESEHWTLPAFARYEDEVTPTERADVVVRADDASHPAWSGFG